MSGQGRRDSLPSALIWDVDGTLAETEHDGHRVAFNQAFAEAGLPWHWDEPVYRQLLATTGGKERIAAWWQQQDPTAAAAAGAAARMTARITALHQRKTALYAARVAQGQVQLRPGVRRLLMEARAFGVRLAIATTTTPANVVALLQATLGAHSPGWFEVIGAGDVVPAKKPAPDIYHWVLARLNQRQALRPSDCVALEDSAPGLAAALAAGLPTVLTRSRYSQDLQLACGPQPLIEPRPARPSAPVAPHPPPAAPSARGLLLADLDQLGSHGQPAQGWAGGQAWRGLVDLATLGAWHQTALRADLADQTAARADLRDQTATRADLRDQTAASARGPLRSARAA